MKIDPNAMIGAVIGKIPEAGKNAPAGTAFESVLEGLEKAGDVQGSARPGSIPAACEPSPQTFNALSAGQEAMDLLDSYARALENPALSLKDISPMVDEMQALSSRVAEAGSLLADNDPLRGILDEVESTLNGELLRFRRGDLLG